MNKSSIFFYIYLAFTPTLFSMQGYQTPPPANQGPPLTIEQRDAAQQCLAQCYENFGRTSDIEEQERLQHQINQVRNDLYGAGSDNQKIAHAIWKRKNQPQ